jgi:hypothetical protein
MRKGTKLIASPLSSCSTYRMWHRWNPLTTSFKDTNRFCFTARIMGLINTFTQRLTSFHRRCARCIRCGPAYSTERPKQTRRRMELSTDTVLETAGLRPIEENIRRRRDTALCFASERYAIYTGNVWHPFLFPLACTGMHGTLFPYSKYPYTGLCICTVPVQIILYNIVVYK